MSAVCPNGHTSGAEDFCDTCGAKIDLENQPEAAAAPEPEAAVGAGSSAAGESGSAAVAAEQPVRDAAVRRAAELDERQRLFGVPTVPQQRGGA